MDTLRNEIVESQKARTDLMKWKLLLVAGLGAAGLGFTNNFGNNNEFDIRLVLCLIPFVCAYVDLLCRHLFLRILIIGKFIRETSATVNNSELLKQYEEFVKNARMVKYDGGKVKFNSYGFENWALFLSSIIINCFLLLYPIVAYCSSNQIYFISIFIMISGGIGIVISSIIESIYSERKDIILDENFSLLKEA